MAITITKPTVGGSEDSWGTTINTALDDVVNALNGTAGTVAPDHTVLTINGTDVTSTAAELNILDGVTATAAELNILDGVTATAAELNILDGVTSTATELNILDGANITTAELNILDGGTNATSTTVVDADRVVFNDDGTMKQVAMSDLKTYINASVGTGSVTSVAMTVPTGLTVSGSPITTSGTLAVSLQSGYSIPTTSSQSNWNTAYGWGDHSTQGYAVGTIPTNNNQLTNGAGYITSVPTTVAAVGTYTFALSSVVPSPVPAGTVSGSQLTYSDGSGSNNVGARPSVGTWRLMAHYINRSSLFVRIS